MRILIFTNGFLNNNAAMKLGCQILQRVDETPTLLNVIEPNFDRHPPKIEAILADACQGMDIEKVEMRVRIGHLPDEIIQEAQDGGYDLLMVSDKKKNVMSRLFQKPLVVKITERVPCSVLVVKGKVDEEIKRILICDSGGGNSSLLRQFVTRMGKLLQGDENITILHVMSQISAGPGVRGGQLRAEADTLIQEHTPEGGLLARDLETLMQHGLKPTPKVRHGLVVDEILAEAENGDYDLVVIGAHPRTGWQGYLLDDLARKILTQITRPVLVVKYTL